MTQNMSKLGITAGPLKCCFARPEVGEKSELRNNAKKQVATGRVPPREEVSSGTQPNTPGEAPKLTSQYQTACAKAIEGKCPPYYGLFNVECSRAQYYCLMAASGQQT
jgi:hypothetical protein